MQFSGNISSGGTQCTFILSALKSTQCDHIVHSCLLWSNTSKVACLSQTTVSGAVRWTWNKCTLNWNQIFSAHHLHFFSREYEKKTNNPPVEISAPFFFLFTFYYLLPIIRFVLVLWMFLMVQKLRFGDWLCVLISLQTG